MAYIVQDDELDEKKKQQGSTVLSSGDSAAPLAPSGGSGNASDPGKPQAPTGSDVSTYKRIQTLNQDQASTLGTNIANKALEKTTGQVRSTADEVKNAFNQSLSQNTYELSPDTKTFIDSTLSKPTGVSQEDAQKFTNIRNANTSQQQELSSADLAKINAAKQSGQQYVEGLQTPEGRSQALKDLYASTLRGAAPTKQQMAFDNMLFTNNKNVAPIFQDAVTNYSESVGGIENSLREQAAAQAAAQLAKNKETVDYLNTGYNNAASSFKSRINDEVARRQQEYNETRKLIDEFLKNYETAPLTKEEMLNRAPDTIKMGAESQSPNYSKAMEALGLTPEQVKQLIDTEKSGTDIDLAKYFHEAATPSYTTGGVASDEDRAFWQSLNQLMAKEDNFLQGTNADGSLNFDWENAFADASYKEPLPQPPASPQPASPESGGGGNSTSLVEALGGIKTAMDVYGRARDLYNQYRTGNTAGAETFDQWVAKNDPSYAARLSAIGAGASTVLNGLSSLATTPAGNVAIQFGDDIISGAAGAAATTGTTTGAALGGGASADAVVQGASQAGVTGTALQALGTAVAIYGAVTGAQQLLDAYKAGNVKSGMAAGASTGASVGSLFGPIGFVAGGIIGGALGAIGVGAGGSSGNARDKAVWDAFRKVPAGTLFRDSGFPLSQAFDAAMRKGTGNTQVKAFTGQTAAEQRGVSGYAPQFYARNALIKEILTAQQQGKLPSDPAALSLISGNGFFEKEIAPKIWGNGVAVDPDLKNLMGHMVDNLFHHGVPSNVKLDSKTGNLQIQGPSYSQMDQRTLAELANSDPQAMAELMRREGR